VRNKVHYACIEDGWVWCRGGMATKKITHNPSEVTCKKCLLMLKTRALMKDKEKMNV
jgi:hypothetical protein